MSKPARIGSLILLLILFCSLLRGEEKVEVLVERKDLPEVVWIEFQLTVINLDRKEDIKTVQLSQEFNFKLWERIYKVLTQKELNTYKNGKMIKATPVILYIKTI